MLLNWVVLFNELKVHDRRERRDPFADPLDRPEWRGFLWVIPAIARLTARRGAETRVPRGDESRIAAGLRFRSSAAAHGAGIPD
ncbi:hypothetical protein NE852_06885 [Rhizobium sp. Pop5]|uniref:hypothetical protein n=1 Tax=Rhizobium sp. Pop5 TaxID=1223565 RepID=UPI000FFCAF67|nr:hypothetical protein [Rhizobium sp. Pop5]UVD57923.1 hypothetical protein NE852_06885 [Rhizobium sp. Pop5]